MLGYTDPGTGTLLLQLIATSFVGLLFYSKKILARVRSIFLKNKQSTESE